MAEVATAIVVGFAVTAATQLVVGSLFGGEASGGGATSTGPKLEELKPIRMNEGAPLWRFAGRRARIPGTVIFCSKIKEKKIVESSGGPVPIITITYEYSVDIAISWGQAIGNKGKIFAIRQVIANGKPVWKKGKESRFDHRWKDWRNVLGGRNTNPDPMLEDAKGNGKVSGYRDTVASFVNDFKLEDFGNQIPQSWYAIVEPDEGPYKTAAAIIDVAKSVPDVEARVDELIDVTEVTGSNMVVDQDAGDEFPFRGIQIEGPQAASKTLEMILAAYDVTCQHSGDGKLHFFDRGKEKVVVIDAGDLAPADVGRAGSERPLQLYRSDPQELPSQVVVNYLDPKNRLQRASETYVVNAATTRENIVTVDMPMVFSRKTARRIAKRRAIEPYRLRDEGLYHLPWGRYFHLDEADLAAVPFNGQVFYVRGLDVTHGADWRIEVRGKIEHVKAGDDEILSDAAGSLDNPDDDDDDPDDDPDQDDLDEDDNGYRPPLMRVVIADTPPFSDYECVNAGLQFGHCAEDPEALFLGAKVYKSGTANGPWDQIGNSRRFASESTIGLVMKADNGLGVVTPHVPDSTAAWGGFVDTATRITVQMFDGVLESVTENEMFSGLNHVLIGKEVLAFMTAEPVSSTETSLVDCQLEIVAPNKVKRNAAGPDFTTLMEPGSYVRVKGFQLGDNDVIFLPCATVTVNEFTLDVGDWGTLFNEGPLADGAPASIVVQGDTYVLRNLLRGRRDTMDHASEHEAGETALFLGRGSTDFIDQARNKIGKKRWFKSVPKGAELSDVQPVSVKLVGETMRPFRPWSFQGIRGDDGTCGGAGIGLGSAPGGNPRPEEWDNGEDTWGDFDPATDPGDGTGRLLATDDITFYWWHRTRLPYPDPTAEQIHDLVLEHNKDQYRLYLYSNETMTNLLRKVKIKGPADHEDPWPAMRSWTYTEALQSVDVWGGPGSQVWAAIQQDGEVVNDGNTSYCTVPPRS